MNHLSTTCLQARVTLGKTLLALSATCLSSWATAAPSQLVVFGDSLSDTGKVQAAFKDALNIQLPDAPYDNGRFSNGPVAVEVLAQQLQVPLTSLAYGGALTGTSNRITTAGVLTGTGTQSQITGYIQAKQGVLDANALYVVWAGGNDFFTAPTAATVGSATANLLQGVSALYSAGARQFLIPNLPDLANTIDSIKAGGAVQAGAHALSVAFNGALAQTFAQAQASLPGARIEVFDTDGVLSALRAYYIAKGGVVNQACWVGNYQGVGTQCSTPDTHFMWDNVHPTAKVHQVVGEAFARSNIVVSSVPEPSSWTLACVGLVGMLGAMGMGRRRAV